jgi:hypothetical protein
MLSFWRENACLDAEWIAFLILHDRIGEEPPAVLDHVFSAWSVSSIPMFTMPYFWNVLLFAFGGAYVRAALDLWTTVRFFSRLQVQGTRHLSQDAQHSI